MCYIVVKSSKFNFYILHLFNHRELLPRELQKKKIIHICLQRYPSARYHLQRVNAFLVHLDQTIAITWRPSSVDCKLFSFQASFPKPLGQLEPNLAGMFLGWSSTKLLFFVPVGYSTWLPGPIIL
jgi:hypothetical protein